MHYLPYIHSKSFGSLIDPWELAPGTFSMSYLNPSLDTPQGSIRDPLESGHNGIAPWSFRLTEGAKDGTHFIYNVKDRTYIMSPHAICISHPSQKQSSHSMRT